MLRPIRSALNKWDKFMPPPHLRSSFIQGCWKKLHTHIEVHQPGRGHEGTLRHQYTHFNQTNKITSDLYWIKGSDEISHSVRGPSRPVTGKYNYRDNSDCSFANGLINSPFGRHYFWKWWHLYEITQSTMDLICVNPSGRQENGKARSCIFVTVNFALWRENVQKSFAQSI